MMEQEQWKPIKGYEGKYDVSNFGRVRSYYKGLHIKTQRINNCGYCYVKLYVKGKRQKMARVNRLVAEAFIPNPDNLSDVNHKDMNKTNNHFDKEKGEAIVTYNRDPREVVSFHEGTPTSRTEYPSVTFTDVEDVIYVTDQNTGSYHYNGSEIERLQEVVKNNISYQTDLIVKCNQQAAVIEEYAFFLRRVSPHQKWHKFMKEELELLDKKVREKFPKFDVYFGRNDDN